MAGRAAELIADLHYEGSYIIPWGGDEVAMTTIQSRQVAHLQYFAAIAGRLEGLSQKELAQQCFTSDDLAFVDGLMENLELGCGTRTYTGWYPQLFYRTIYWTSDTQFDLIFGAGAPDPLVADVHTDVPSVGNPGSVLHEAVGRVNLLLMVVDNGADCFLCAGPVLSHYELEVTGAPRRLNDEEWTLMVSEGRFPDDIDPQRVEGLPPPPWTQSYLVPR